MKVIVFRVYLERQTAKDKDKQRQIQRDIDRDKQSQIQRDIENDKHRERLRQTGREKENRGK